MDTTGTGGYETRSVQVRKTGRNKFRGTTKKGKGAKGLRGLLG